MIQHYVCWHCGDVETVDSDLIGGMRILEEQFGWDISIKPSGLPERLLCPICQIEIQDTLASAKEAVSRCSVYI